MASGTVRIDHGIILDLVGAGSRVLDLGCGKGELIARLAGEKDARVQGIELDAGAVRECIRKGLSVFHSDIESGLSDYPDLSFDYVILNQSLQEIHKPEYLIREALRVGRRAVVGFPNFAHIRSRFELFFRGRAPVTAALPHPWYDTPNVRFLSITDFREFCRAMGFCVICERYAGNTREVFFWPNLSAKSAIFVLAAGGAARFPESVRI
jgi:methionine biosynthesis protein MetW